MIEDSWTLVEVILHRWLRESTEIAGDRVAWPKAGLPRKSAPCIELRVLGGRGYAQPGSGETRSEQPVEWLVTVQAGEGEHTIDLLVQGEDEPFATASVTSPEDTSIEDARDALLEEATEQFPDLEVSASGDAAIAFVGSDALNTYHLAVGDTLEAELVKGPEQVVRATPQDVVVSIEFRSAATAGGGTARAMAWSAKNAMPDWSALLERAGWKWGAIVGDRLGYEADASESRHVLDIQLLGHVVDVRRPTPWVRTVRATISSSGMPDQTIEHG